MNPSLAGFASKHGDKVVVLKVNVDRQKELARKARVRGIPDLRLCYEGKQLDRKIGGQSQSSLENLMKKHAKRLPKPAASGSSRQAVASSSSAKPTSKASASGQAADAQGESSGGSIVAMSKGWLPPGVTPD